MVKCLSDESNCSPCSFNIVSSHYDNLTVKRIQVISPHKVFVLLVYIILSYGVTHLNAQSCSLCKLTHSPRDKDLKELNYEEYLFEHQVTRQNAINALQTLNQSFYDGPPARSCKSITCTRNVMKYCYGPQFINDHCWCELGHAKEGLPFIPHICYVGDKQYQASVGSCFFYEEVKDCCCAPALARHWKHISAGSTNIPFPYTSQVALALLTTCSTQVLIYAFGCGNYKRISALY